MKNKMEKTAQYLKETLGLEQTIIPIAKTNMNRLPLYILELYNLYDTDLFNTKILLAELKNEDEISILQTEKQVKQIKNILNQNVVVVLENIQAFNRKRLIEKGINFIVPGKQIYMPDLLMDLRESFVHPNIKIRNEPLLPSAQFLLIHHIIYRHPKWCMEERPFKEIAQKLEYTPMTISNAIENLKYHDLVEVKGDKEKFIRFRLERHELWNTSIKFNLLRSPVIKTVFVDEKPKGLFLLECNESAIPEYTDLNPSRQKYYAVEKSVFYDLQKSKALVNQNDYEGKYALEVWKYNPLILVNELSNDLPVVDPLSLYLSLYDKEDERIEIALDQIIDKYIW